MSVLPRTHSRGSDLPVGITPTLHGLTPVVRPSSGATRGLPLVGLVASYVVVAAVVAHEQSIPTAVGALVLLVGVQTVRRALGPTTSNADLLSSLLRERARADFIQSRLRRDESTLHEVRSTIAGISMASQIIDAQTVPGSERTHRVDRLRRTRDSEIARLERLLAVPVGAQSRDSDAPLDVVRLDEIIEPLVVSQEACGTTVHWQASGVTVFGAPDLVSEVTHVLLDNAARHAPGSPVDVSVEYSESEVRLRVADHGRGVDHALQDEIFEWGARRPSSPGCGIGLAAAREHALSMGGRLELARPVEAAGAVFDLYLSAAPRTTPCPAQPA